MLIVYLLVALFAAAGLVFLLTLTKLHAGNKRVAAEMAAGRNGKLTDIGAVKQLTILPLVDFYAALCCRYGAGRSSIKPAWRYQKSS